MNSSKTKTLRVGEFYAGNKIEQQRRRQSAAATLKKLRKNYKLAGADSKKLREEGRR